MFCYNCGTKIDDNAKFCFNCGTRINVSNEVELEKPINDEIVKRFSIFDTTIELSTIDFDNVRFIQEMTEIAYEYRLELLDYRCENITANNQLNLIETFCKGQYEKFIEQIAFRLKQYEISEYDLHNCFLWSDSEICAIIEKNKRDIYMEKQDLLKQKEIEKAYNQAKKDSRMKFVGGGFGLTGATKGIVTASALNATTGALYSIRNAFSNSSIDAEYQRRINSISSRQYISNEFEETILLDYLVMIMDCVNMLIKKGVQFRFNRSSRKEANFYYEKICKLEPDRFCEIPELASKMFTLYPLKEAYYKAVCERIGDSKRQLIELAKSLNLDTSDMEKAVVSYEYSEMLCGSIRSDIERETRSHDHVFHRLDDSFRNFTNYGINKYIVSDPNYFVMNYFAILSKKFNSSYRESSWGPYSGEAKRFLSDKIKFDYVQALVLLIRCEGYDYGELNEKDKKNYIALTSENLYTSELKIPIMEIFSIEDSVFVHELIINKNIKIKFSKYDYEFAQMIYTAVFYLQLLHQLYEKDKFIPLLKGEPGDKEHLVYYDLGIAAIDKNFMFTPDLVKQLEEIKCVGIRGLTSEEEMKEHEEVFHLQEDERILIDYLNIDAKNYIVITNKRVLFYIDKLVDSIDLPTDIYVRINPTEDGYFDIQIDQNRKYRIIATGDAKSNANIAKWFSRLIFHYSHIDSQYSDVEKWMEYKKIEEPLVDASKYFGLDIKSMISGILGEFYAKQKFLSSTGNPSGISMTGKVPVYVQNFKCVEGEVIYLHTVFPLFKKPLTSGMLVTSEGISAINDGVLRKISWDEFKNSKGNIKQDDFHRIYIDDLIYFHFLAGTDQNAGVEFFRAMYKALNE